MDVETSEKKSSNPNVELSALRDNIEKKGKNSYYYAHGPKIDGPVWDGKEEPRLLSRTVSEEGSPRTRTSRALTEYAWGDGKKIVTIYLDFQDAENIPDDIISLTTTSESVTFTLQNYNGVDYKLFIDNLTSEVSGATFKKKEGQFRIILKKLEESPWFSLKKK